MPNLSQQEKEAFLRTVHFFAKCSDRELHDVASLAEERELGVGAELCHQGEFESEVFVIVDGAAEVTIDGAHVATEGRGHIVGELSMLGTGRRSATLRVVAALRVLAIDPREIDSVLAADPSSAGRLSEHGGDA